MASKDTYIDDLDGPAAPEGSERPLIVGRYEDLGPLAEGGMGEVRRVRDLELGRTLAMKLVHPRLLGHPRAMGRFLEEAQATAQLQHPGIVPIYDIGTLPDGRAWFTMKEVEGVTLGRAAQWVHAASDGRWQPGEQGWSFRRVITSFHAVCLAVAFAHERGVVHRDLKPDNVMVGRHGETTVLDWGLAKVLGSATRDPLQLDLDAEPVRTDRSGSHPTRMGTVAGTPAYMSPEQARGEVDRLDARSDVYSLGALLYELLSGHPPYDGTTTDDVVASVRGGAPPPLAQSARLPLPDELVAACERAMCRDPDERLPSARALAQEVESWLDGARKRDQALEITARSLLGATEAQAMLDRASALQARGEALLAPIQSWRPEADKAPGWDLLREAAALRRAAELRELEVDQGLHGALQVAADLPEAHAALVQRYLDRFAAAEAARDDDATARAEVLVRHHAAALPALHPVRLASDRTLEGIGALSLRSEPSGAEVKLFRYEERNRRHVPVAMGRLGATPLTAVPLPMGRYLAVIQHPGHQEVRYPVAIPRLGLWSGVPPGGAETEPVWLPPEGALSDEEIYVPAGWFQSGADPGAPNPLPDRWLWCDGFAMHRFQVTNRDFLAYLDHRVAHGKAEEALRHAPRERASSADQEGALVYAFDGSHFSLSPDADGDVWELDWPVLMVDWHGARAYLAWLAEQTGRPWRLATELEWEKAARGVDGRYFPWGDHHDPSWCHMTESHAAYRQPVVVQGCPVDESPYGVRGLAGNAEDWCLDLYERPCEVRGERVLDGVVDSPEVQRATRVARGGSWLGASTYARAAHRVRLAASDRHPGVGFRGVFRL